jgi:chaperonin GroES
MKSQLVPLYDRIVVRPLTDSERKVGSLYIPDVAKEKPQIGVVLAVGPGEPLPHGVIKVPVLSPGDKVLYNKYAGSEVTVDDEEYLILRESDVLAKVIELEEPAQAKSTIASFEMSPELAERLGGEPSID